jgi:protein-export chaperone SecB
MSNSVFTAKNFYVKHISLKMLCTADEIQKVEHTQNEILLYVAHKKIQRANQYEVTLSVTVINRQNQQILWIMKVKQAGIFVLDAHLSAEQQKQMLEVNCSNQLYCYASCIVSQMTTFGNIQKVILSPVDFNKLHRAHKTVSQLDSKKRYQYYNQRGHTYFKHEDYEQAIDCYKKALIDGENCGSVFFNIGTAFWKLNRFQEAIIAYKQSVQHNPKFSKSYAMLAFTLTHINQLDEAERYYHLALKFNPTNADYYSNLGVNYKKQNKVDQAIDCFEKALSIKPDVAKNQVNEALCLLSKGDFANGWEKYEARFGLEELERYADHHFSKPRWQGENLQDKTLFVHVEQGLGDTLQFIRYLPLIAEQGAKIVLSCYNRLIPLLEKIKDNLKITKVVPSVSIDKCPAFDYHISLLSLPRLFKTNTENIPLSEGYIILPKDLNDSRNQVYTRLKNDKRFKVGIVWAGNKKHKEDKNRSMKLEYFKPLFSHNQIGFYSLQYGNQTLEIHQNGLNEQLIDLSKGIRNFYDTAKLIEQLDLVIAVDTVISHLSGAMAKPTWVLLNFSPDFRWLLDREDSPWYKSVRLFRQATVGNWESVIARINAGLTNRESIIE